MASVMPRTVSFAVQTTPNDPFPRILLSDKSYRVSRVYVLPLTTVATGSVDMLTVAEILMLPTNQKMLCAHVRMQKEFVKCQGKQKVQVV